MISFWFIKQLGLSRVNQALGRFDYQVGFKNSGYIKKKISKTTKKLILFQYHYIEKSLDKFYKGDNSIVKTLIDISVICPRIHVRE